MTYSLREKRCILKSAVNHIRTQVNASFSDVNVVYSFKQAAKSTKPVICVQIKSTDHIRKEVGSTSLWDSHLLIINVFSRSAGQTEDLVDFIVAQIKSGFIYNDYAKVNSTDATWTATANGKVNVVSWERDEVMDFEGATSEIDMHRHMLAVIVRTT